jgi:hypothetical protein
MSKSPRVAPPARALAAFAAALGAAPTSAAAAPCTPAQAAGARAPVTIVEATPDEPAVEFLVAGRRYRVLVVQELGDGGGGSVDPASIAVTGPPGLPLEPGTSDGRARYDFTPTAVGPLQLGVSWQLVLRDATGGRCELSANVERLVKAAGPVRVGPGRFRPGGQDNDIWVLPIVAPPLVRTDPVTIALRFRLGSTAPPPAGGPAVTTRVRVDERGRFTSGRPLRFRLFEVDVTSLLDPAARERPRTAYVRVYARNLPTVGGVVRFAFSLEVRQGGERVGGMRSGAVCRRVQLPGHSVTRCTHPGLAPRP